MAILVQNDLVRKSAAVLGELPSLVVARAETALAATGYAPLKHLRCTYHEGILVLHGTLPSFFLKQMAQSCVMKLPGVQQVVNRTAVPCSPGPDDAD